MKWLTLIIFFISFLNSLALWCITPDDRMPLNESLQNFDFDQFMNKIENFSSIENEDYRPCRIKLYINYMEQVLIIKFTEHLESNPLENQDVHIHTFIYGTNVQDMHIKHYFTHACSIDNCEKDILYRHLSWFLTANYPQLSDRLAPLFFSESEESGKCFGKDGMTNECDSGQCAAYIEREKNKELWIEQICADNEQMQLAGLHFKAFFNLEKDEIDLTLVFHCHYDGCNSKNIVENVTRIFDAIYKIDSVLRMFGYADDSKEDNQDMTTDFTNLSNSSTVQTKIKTTSSAFTTNQQYITISNTTITTSVTTTQTNVGSYVQPVNTIIYGILIISVLRSIVSTLT